MRFPTRFTADDVERAHDEWGANCGPAAIAAVLGMSLDELRPHMGDFEQKHYMNPTLMWEVLDRLGVNYSVGRKDRWPFYGLARIQWTGPWTKPGVPARAAYRQTHWVGVNAVNKSNIGIFDINAIDNESGWCALGDWDRVVVPWILENCVPKADGGWFVTHSVEIQRRHKVPEGQCKYCDDERAKGNDHHPGHDASYRCESGRYTHCTCDTCF